MTPYCVVPERGNRSFLVRLVKDKNTRVLVDGKLAVVKLCLALHKVDAVVAIVPLVDRVGAL